MVRCERPYDRLVLATRALRKDEDCIEARLVVAAHCDDIELRLLHLSVAVETGETTWRSSAVRLVVGEDHGIVPGSLPWVRNLKALGDAVRGGLRKLPGVATNVFWNSTLRTGRASGHTQSATSSPWRRAGSRWRGIRQGRHSVDARDGPSRRCAIGSTVDDGKSPLRSQGAPYSARPSSKRR